MCQHAIRSIVGSGRACVLLYRVISHMSSSVASVLPDCRLLLPYNIFVQSKGLALARKKITKKITKLKTSGVQSSRKIRYLAKEFFSLSHTNSKYLWGPNIHFPEKGEPKKRVEREDRNNKVRFNNNCGNKIGTKKKYPNTTQNSKNRKEDNFLSSNRKPTMAEPFNYDFSS